MMCKVLIFGCIAAVILTTAAYGAPLSLAQRKQHLEAAILDLELLKDIENVSGDFLLSEDSFVIIFFYVFFSEKLTFFPFSTEFS